MTEVQAASMTLDNFAQMITEVRTSQEVQKVTAMLTKQGSQFLTYQVKLETDGTAVWKVELFGHDFGIMHTAGQQVAIIDPDNLLEVIAGPAYDDSTAAVGRTLLVLSNAIEQAHNERKELHGHLVSLEHWDRDRLAKIFQGYE